jgi:hypothetical protein
MSSAQEGAVDAQLIIVAAAIAAARKVPTIQPQILMRFRQATNVSLASTTVWRSMPTVVAISALRGR